MHPAGPALAGIDGQRMAIGQHGSWIIALLKLIPFDKGLGASRRCARLARPFRPPARSATSPLLAKCARSDSVTRLNTRTRSPSASGR